MKPEIPYEVALIDAALQDIDFAKREPNTKERKRHIMRSFVKLMYTTYAEAVARSWNWNMNEGAGITLLNIAMMAATKGPVEAQRYHAVTSLIEAFKSPEDAKSLCKAKEEVATYREMFLQGLI